MLRAERGISRRQLADALGVHYQTVGYLERGEYSPSLHLALRIAEYFEVPVEVLFSLPRSRGWGAAESRPEPAGPCEITVDLAVGSYRKPVYIGPKRRTQLQDRRTRARRKQDTS